MDRETLQKLINDDDLGLLTLSEDEIKLNSTLELYKITLPNYTSEELYKELNRIWDLDIPLEYKKALSKAICDESKRRVYASGIRMVEMPV